jgi:hypothetical protein
MIQIRQNDVVTDFAALEEIRNTFTERHCVLLRQFVNPALLARLLPLLANTPAHERVPGMASGRVIARERCLERDSTVVRAFNLLFNNPAIFRLVEQITGSPRIGNFRGRIYMMQPGPEHFDTWHSDNDGNRLIGLSLNLSDTYSGGAFQIRDRRSEQVVGQICNTVLGDTHIFRIAPELQHRVTPVTGEVTKIAYAGWFRAQPGLREMYRADED